ncbi:MAG: hypothetical protein PHW74_04390 [Desulfobacca sp.]|nr:hypothetical protein [Desulfobacca sp.]
MELKYIIATLILSDFYLTMPLKERKALVHRLYCLYGRHAYNGGRAEPETETQSKASVRLG